MENFDKNFIVDGNKIAGRAIAAALFDQVKQRVGQLPFKPLLCDVVVGNDPVSLSYVKIKGKKAEDCGMGFDLIQLPEESNDEQVCDAILTEQQKDELAGLIVQLPLPGHLKTKRILGMIGEDVDVDVINPNNEQKMMPATAGAIMHILKQLPINLYEENILILGQGELVGKPVAHALTTEGLKFLIATAETENRAQLLQDATVIISGVGKAGVLHGDEVSDGVIVIDAGTSEQGGSIYGDADFESIAPKARYITPSPGGVGPVTVAKLLENVVTVAESK